MISVCSVKGDLLDRRNDLFGNKLKFAYEELKTQSPSGLQLAQPAHIEAKGRSITA